MSDREARAEHRRVYREQRREVTNRWFGGNFGKADEVLDVLDGVACHTLAEWSDVEKLMSIIMGAKIKEPAIELRVCSVCGQTPGTARDGWLYDHMNQGKHCPGSGT